MHELPITKSIFKTVVSRAEKAGASHVNKVVLEIGILRDFVPSMVQKYWDYIAPGTIAEGAKVEIIDIDAAAQCGRCGNEYTITRERVADAKCPVCGHEGGRLIGGDELRIKGIEIVKHHTEDNGTVQRPAQED